MIMWVNLLANYVLSKYYNSFTEYNAI